MNLRQLVFQPMPGSTLITGSLLFKLCPYFLSVQFKLFAALESKEYLNFTPPSPAKDTKTTGN